MSEPIPESIPTSSDRKSHRPTKKRALTPSSQQSAQVDALFANLDREINIPSGPTAKTVLAPPEIVANVQGSSAGAGSGEFHVYKASRRREYERLRLMDEEVEKEEKDREWEQKKEDRKKEDEEKLSKNRAKRAKQKARKEKADMTKKMGGMEVDGEGGKKANGSVVKKKLVPAKIAAAGNGNAKDEGEEEDVKMNGNGNGNGEAVTDDGGITFHDDD